MWLEDEDSEDSFGDIDSDDQGSEVEETEKQKPAIDLKVCLTLNYITVLSFGDIDSDDQGSEVEETEKQKPAVDLKVCLTLNYTFVLGEWVKTYFII